MVDENINSKNEKRILANKSRSEKMKLVWLKPSHYLTVPKKISEAKKGKSHPPHSEETKKKMSLNNGRYWEGKKHTEEHKNKIRNTMKLYRQNPSVKEKTSEVSKQLWRNEEYREMVIKNALKGLIKRPTSFEQKIIELIQGNNLPFKYVGNGQIVINFKNPDFIECNGRKLLIETYCKFWHPKDYEEVRAKIFSEYGYKTLFLNEDDICVDNWKEVCLNKMRVFLGEI